MKFFLPIICFILSTQIYAQPIKLNKQWKAKEQLSVPESVVYLARKKELYVSLIDGEGNVKDAKAA